MIFKTILIADGFIVINWTRTFMVCDSAVDRFRIGNGIIQSAEFRRGREDNAPSFLVA